MSKSGMRVSRLGWIIAVTLVAGGGSAGVWTAAHHYVSRWVSESAFESEDEDHDRRPGADSPDQAMQWVLLAYRDENGNIPRDGLMRARAQADAMRVVSVQNAEAVQAAGGIQSTAGITRGGWTWVGPGNVGGRVRAIAIHPTATNVILAGSVSGGIWKSSDFGQSWRVIDDFMANLAVSTLVFRPGDPARVFAATGEGFFNQDAIKGAGIFVSNDTGESWSQLPSTANSNFDFVNRIAFSSDGAVLVAATRTGLFRSADLGASWTPVLAQPDMLDVKFLPGSSTQAVAAGRNKNAYVSTNGGVSWATSNGFGAPISGERIELGVSRSSPNVVYASLDESSGQIWKSSDSGASYVRVSTPAHLSTQGWYDNAIWVDPTNADHVVVGGVSSSQSTNGAVSFTNVSVCHSDQHAIVGDPNYNGSSNRRVYFGSDGGVCKLEDVNVNTVTSLRNGLGITQFYGGGGNANAGRVMGGTQDNGTLMYNLSTGTTSWTTEFGSDGGFAAIDPSDPNVMYGEIQNFRLHRTLNGASPQYIYGGSGSQSCSKPAPYQISDACDGLSNFIAPFMLDPNNRDRLLAGGRSLWRTNDARTLNSATTGPRWLAIKGPTSANSNISAIAVAPGNSDVVWVGHNNGDLYVSLNGTSDSPGWARVDVNAPGLPNRTVTSIVIDAIDPAIAYVGFGGFSPDNIWRTTNAGATWTDITGSGGGALPDVPVRSVVIHPTNPSWLYAATDVGVFATEDGGATWSLPHEGPSNVPVFQLFWMDTLLVAVTHGRGLYTVPAATALPSFVKRPLSQGVIPGQTVTFNVLATGIGPITYQWYRGTSGDTSNPVAGATSTSLTTAPITQTTTYWVRASNNLGSADSNTATLTPMQWGALTPGSTTQNPTENLQSASASAGGGATSSASAVVNSTTTTSAPASTAAATSGLFPVPVALVGGATTVPQVLGSSGSQTVGSSGSQVLGSSGPQVLGFSGPPVVGFAGSPAVGSMSSQSVGSGPAVSSSSPQGIVSSGGLFAAPVPARVGIAAGATTPVPERVSPESAAVAGAGASEISSAVNASIPEPELLRTRGSEARLTGVPSSATTFEPALDRAPEGANSRAPERSNRLVLMVLMGAALVLPAIVAALIMRRT